MFAVVEIAGQQFKVQEGQEIYVHRLEGEAGSNVEFDNVLLVDRDGSVDVGTPSVKATVKATILEHLQGDKVIVFKKKRRKGYRVKNGHRQQFTKVKIDGIA